MIVNLSDCILSPDNTSQMIKFSFTHAVWLEVRLMDKGIEGRVGSSGCELVRWLAPWLSQIKMFEDAVKACKHHIKRVVCRDAGAGLDLQKLEALRPVQSLGREHSFWRVSENLGQR